MSTSDLNLSFNEIMFYFTRAAVGGGVPFGLAEVFGCAAIWIAASGLDPVGITASALKELEYGQSCIKTNLKDVNNKIILTSERRKKLSAIHAGSAVCDLISEQYGKQKKNKCIIVEKVDFPFLICAALGAANCNGWEISWCFKNNIQYSVLICDDGSWKSSWECSKIPELNDAVDVKIIFFSNRKDLIKKWGGKTFYSYNNKQKLLETGVPVSDSWPVIYSYFQRCLVPSTEESRKTGAGAGLLDKD